MRVLLVGMLLVATVGFGQDTLPPGQASADTRTVADLPSAPSNYATVSAGKMPMPPTESPSAFSPAAAPIRSVAKAPGDGGQNARARDKRFWLILTATQHAAATFDAVTTRRKTGTGRYREDNPLLRPFAGNASLYAVVQIGPVLLDFAGRRMQKSNVRFVRQLWWLPQSAQTATHLAFGAWNLTK